MEMKAIVFTNVTLLFFLLLIPLAGFIAWAGDRIGHKTGKRRQSLLGLRPRHTAMIFTIGSGMAIALVSFGLFYALSQTFRVVVRDGAELYRHNIQLKLENNHQAVLLQSTRELATRAQQETQRYNQERAAAEKSRNVILKELQLAEKRAADAQHNYEKANSGRELALKDFNSAKTRLDEVQGELKTNVVRIQEAQKRLRIASEKVKTAQLKASQAEDQYQTAIKDRNNARADVVAARQETQKVTQNALRILKDQASELNGQITRVTNRLEDQNKTLDELKTKTEQQRSELDSLNTQLAQRRSEYNQLVAATDALRRRQITFQVGEEVGRVSLRGGYNTWRLQGMLRAFLGNAAKKAERRGAAKGSEDRAVDIATNGVFANGDPVSISGKQDEDNAIRAAAEVIRKLNQEVVVLAVACTNAVVGEPVAVDLRIFRNPVVLFEGQKISEGVVRSDGTRQEVADALAMYMSREVHIKLMGAGMLPVSRGGETTGDLNTGGMSSDEFTLNGEDWLKLVEDVRRAGSSAKVQVFAARDMRAGDPVALKFTVRGQPNEQAQK
jgi:hypothetical protein